MNDTYKSLVATAGVVTALGAVVLGASRRQQVDLGGGPVLSLEGLVASRDSQVNVPATDYFRDISARLKQEYVEPVDDDMKLATGAVRGMVASLADTKSLFLDKDAFRAFLNARQGQYEGIGVDLVLQVPNRKSNVSRDALQPAPVEDGKVVPPTLGGDADTPVTPRLTVSSVVPGSPAEKAGVKPGDVVDTVDGHWVYSSEPLIQFQKARQAFQAKKISLSQINALRNKLRAKYEKVILPLRAKDKLALGTSGDVNIVWSRNGTLRTTSISKGISTRPEFSTAGDTLLLPVHPGDAEKLTAAVAGKSAVTLDLRGSMYGDFNEMKKCLAVLAPAGDYGNIVNGRKTGNTPLKISSGNSKPPKMTLLVDGSTRGAAEILALALSSKGLAKLSGAETGGDRTVYEIVKLPDGTGYTLAVGDYQVSTPVKGGKK